MIILAMYIAIFVGAYFAVSLLTRGREEKGFNSLKTVTFGDGAQRFPVAIPDGADCATALPGRRR